MPPEEIPDEGVLTEDDMLARIDAGQPVVEEEAEENLAVQGPGAKDHEPTLTLADELAEEARQDEQYRRQEPHEVISEETLTPVEEALLDLDDQLTASVEESRAARDAKVVARGRDYMAGRESITRKRRTITRKRIQRLVGRGQ